MSNGKIAIDEVIVGNRHRKDIGDITDLARSINMVGLLHPIVIDKDNNLIAGLRRLESAKMLDWDEIPCRVVADLEDATKALLAERDENTCRKNFSPIEAVALGKALEELERPRAKARQAEGNSRGGKGGGQVSGKLPETSKAESETRNIVGPAVGMSGRTYAKAKVVVDAAESDPETFGEIAQEMEATGKVSPAYDKVMEMKRNPVIEERTASMKDSMAIAIAHEAVNLLKKIPRNDPKRKRGFQIVSDFMKANQ